MTNGLKKFFAAFTKNYMIILAVLLLIIIFAILRPGAFLRSGNFSNILVQATTISVVAIGQATLMMAGQLDLSLGQNVCLSGYVSCYLMVIQHWNPWLSILAGILVAISVGLLNGLFFTKIGVPAFIATLAMQYVCMGGAELINGTRTIAPLPKEVAFLGRGYIFQVVPVSVVIMIGLYVIMTFILTKTKLGRNIYAIGGNQEAAFFAGINTTKYYLIAFALAGLFAGISSTLLISRLNSVGIGSGKNYEFEAMIGSVIGGVAMSGGKGKLIGVLFGVMFSIILFNGMTLLGVHPFVQDVFKGALLLLAMSFDVIRNKKRN
jgi:ribose transport system permease protein